MLITLKELENTWGWILYFKPSSSQPEILEAHLGNRKNSGSPFQLATLESYDLFCKHHDDIASRMQSEIDHMKTPWLTVLIHLKDYFRFLRESGKEIAEHRLLSSITFEEFCDCHLRTPVVPPEIEVPVFLKPGDNVYELDLEAFPRNGAAVINTHSVMAISVKLNSTIENDNHYNLTPTVTYQTAEGLVFSPVAPVNNQDAPGEIIINQDSKRLFLTMDALRKSWHQTYDNPIVHINDSQQSEYQKFHLKDWLQNESPTNLMGAEALSNHSYDWETASDNAQTQIDEWENRPHQRQS
jgi:hypothetical protein